MTVKRRFIAGAKCPKCQAVDCVVMLSSGENEWIECVDCGYEENRPTQVEDLHSPAEPDEIGVIQFKPRPTK